MNKTRALVAVLFVVAFAAGLTSGLASRQSDSPRAHRGGWLSSQLHLTAKQRQQMLAIWSKVSWGDRRKMMQERRQYQQQRDQAIQKLLSPKQRKQYDAILKSYHQKLASMAAKRHKRFEQAVAKTKAILTPQQRKLYEQAMAQHRGGRHGGRFDHRRRHRPAGTQPGMHRAQGKPGVTAKDQPHTN